MCEVVDWAWYGLGHECIFRVPKLLLEHDADVNSNKASTPSGLRCTPPRVPWSLRHREAALLK